MSSSFRKSLLCGALGFCAISPVSAFAQSERPQGESGLGEVIVTARRVEENLQRVPIALTAITPQILQQGAINDALSLIREVPGLQTYSRTNRGNGTTTALMRFRGVTSIANYFAEVPYTNAGWTFYAPFFDIQGIEALRGPQGTLFGVSSNAGAVLVTPRGPGEDFGGFVNVQVGTYNLNNVEAAVDLPIIEDKVLLRVAGKRLHRDGFVKDVPSGYKMGVDDTAILRGTLVARPFENLENSSILQREENHDVGHAVRVLTDFNQNRTTQLSQQAAINGMTVDQFIAARDQIMATQIANGPYVFDGWSSGCPASASGPATTSIAPGPNFVNARQQSCPPGFGGVNVNWQFFNKTTWTINDALTIKNLYGYFTGHSDGSMLDNDLTRLILQEGNPKGVRQDVKGAISWSDEIQASGSLFGDSLDYVGGVFYTRTQSRANFPGFGAYTTSLADSQTRGTSRSYSYAVYGQANYNFSGALEGLSAAVGLRQTWDAAFTRTEVINPTTGAITAVRGGDGTPAGEGHWKALNYTASVQYQITPETMIYATNAKGYSAGGLQNVSGFEKFEPDSLNNLEAGIKTTFDVGPDIQLRVNLSGYHGWFENVKVQSSFLSTVPGTTIPTVLLATNNAAEAKVRGVEFETFGAYRDNFEFRFWGNFSDNEYTKYPSVHPVTFAPVDLSGTPFTSNPRWRFGFSPTYRWDTEDAGRFSLGASFTYSSEIWTAITKPIVRTDPNDPNTGAECKVQRTAANGYGPASADGGTAWKNCSPSVYNLNITANWDDVLGQEGLSASLSVTNATYNKEWVGNAGLYDILGFTVMDVPAPRMASVSLRYDF